MRLSDIMSSMGLALYPSIALIIFFAVFLLVTARAYSRRARPELDRAASLPFTDPDPSPAVQEKSNGNP